MTDLAPAADDFLYEVFTSYHLCIGFVEVIRLLSKTCSKLNWPEVRVWVEIIVYLCTWLCEEQANRPGCTPPSFNDSWDQLQLLQTTLERNKR